MLPQFSYGISEKNRLLGIGSVSVENLRFATLLGMKATSKLLLSAEQVSSGRVVSSLLSCRWFSSTVNFNLEQIIEEIISILLLDYEALTRSKFALHGVSKTMDVPVIDSDSKIFSETSDGEDIDGRESTYGGHAQNILSSPDESIGKIDDFLSFERGFVNGDVVCSVTDPSGQLGRVMDVVMVVELERVSDGKKLARVKSFATGDSVVHYPWLGRVDRVFDVVTVLVDVGEEYEILVRDSEILVPVSSRYEDTLFQYYPRQYFKVNHQHVSGFASWFCGTRKGSRVEETTENKLPLQIAPICSTEMLKDSGMRSQEMFMITKTKIKVDVLWQNGERSFGLDPQSLSPVSNVGDHDFWPEQFVLEKVTSEDVCVPRIQRLGIVKNVDLYERTVNVKCTVPKIKETVDFSCESVEETVSVGDTVLRWISPTENVEINLPDMQSNVIGYKDECVEVRWASGHVSKVSPFEIFGLDMILSPASMLSSNEETFPANVIKETPDQQKLLSHKKKKNVENNSNEDCTTNKLEVSQYQLLKKELQLGLHNEQLEILRRETIEFKQGDEPIILPEDDKPIKFKQFNVVNDFSDHHFINGIGDGIARSQVKRGWFKKVQQEWSILKRDLPDTIYVRVYEEKMELMRAAILGSPGTPFHDGLFLFDIFFPPDYPHEPPLPGCLDGAQRSHHILNACKAYLDGAQVGHLYSMEGLPAKAAKL
ncbi:hypothetical protein MUK42_18200, partial [Musa troglodytarum]